MLTWVSFLVFYSSYLFSVLFLGGLVFLVFLVNMSSVIFVKYLVVLVYISGVVVFILYISCMCWYLSEGFTKSVLMLSLCVVFFYDKGLVSDLSGVGEMMWVFLFFSFLFNSLVVGYSSNLFKVSGSLRL